LHLCSAYINRCFLALSRHSAEGGIADLRRVVQIAREDGHPFYERAASFNLAELMFWSGEQEEALALVRRARTIEERFDGRVQPHTPLLLARIHAARGEPEDVQRELGWLRAHAADEGWRATERLLVRALELLDGGTPMAWDELVEQAHAQLPPEELLEVLYWRSRAAPELAERILVEAEPLLVERPFWRARFGLVLNRSQTRCS
jgi:hypothetical protein